MVADRILRLLGSGPRGTQGGLMEWARIRNRRVASHSRLIQRATRPWPEGKSMMRRGTLVRIAVWQRLSAVRPAAMYSSKSLAIWSLAETVRSKPSIAAAIIYRISSSNPHEMEAGESTRTIRQARVHPAARQRLEIATNSGAGSTRQARSARRATAIWISSRFARSARSDEPSFKEAWGRDGDLIIAVMAAAG